MPGLCNHQSWLRRESNQVDVILWRRNSNTTKLNDIFSLIIATELRRSKELMFNNQIRLSKEYMTPEIPAGNCSSHLSLVSVKQEQSSGLNPNVIRPPKPKFFPLQNKVSIGQNHFLLHIWIDMGYFISDCHP